VDLKKFILTVTLPLYSYSVALTVVIQVAFFYININEIRLY